MTGLNCNCNSRINLNIPSVDDAASDTDAAQAIEPIEIFLNFRRSIDTLNSFLKLTPSDDDFHPIVALIADQLNRTLVAAIPVFASSSAKSWGPTSTNEQHSR